MLVSPAAAALAIVFAGLTAPVACAAPEADIASGRLGSPQTVAEGVWVMRQPDRLWSAVIGNVVIVEQSDGFVLFDSGGSIGDGREIVGAVRALGVKPIKAVVVSHWHNDHPLGVAGILEAFPDARVIATKSAAEAMKTRLNVGVGAVDAEVEQKRLQDSKTIAQMYAETASDSATSLDLKREYQIEARWVRERGERQIGNYVVLPNETFTDRLLLPDTERPIELLHLGAANTAGDAVAWLPRQRIVATGDIVVLPTPYGFSVSTNPWLATLDRLEALDFATLIPGHGKVQTDRGYLATLRWSMHNIAHFAQALAATDATAEQAWSSFDRTAHEIRFGVIGEWERHWLEQYWLKGMFETAFKEARGEPAAAG